MEDNKTIDSNVEVEGGATETENKTYTKDELNEILKGYKSKEEVNDIVAKRLAREKKDIEAKIEAERKEAEELAKLSEAEKQKKLFEKQVREFEETKKAFENEKLLNETSKQLASKNLPIEFAEMLKGKDAESTFENIKTFEEKFNSALEKAVNERLRGNVPKVATNQTVSDNPYSKESWSLTKQMELEMKNPTLAKQLMAQAK